MLRAPSSMASAIAQLATTRMPRERTYMSVTVREFSCVHFNDNQQLFKCLILFLSKFDPIFIIIIFP